jgi:hypothetical protein
LNDPSAGTTLLLTNACWTTLAPGMLAGVEEAGCERFAERVNYFFPPLQAQGVHFGWNIFIQINK